MKFFSLVITSLALLALPTRSLALTPSQVFEMAKDSIVVVKTFDEQNHVIGFGSGVLLPSKKIATNCHVIENSAAFVVGKAGAYIPATLWAGDESKDICILDAPGIEGRPAQIGTAASLKIGEPVYAIGAPRGLELSLTDGIVSQLRGSPFPIIQTTAAISGGSSGGGLFNSQGRLVGLTSLKIKDEQGFNFSMPVEWFSHIKRVESNEVEATQAEEWQRLRAHLHASLQPALADTGVPRTAFSDPANEAAWLADMSKRLANYMPSENERLEFLRTLHWEASRAGVDPQLMLGLIEVESGFRKLYISPKGARGYTQVMPHWIKAIGSEKHNLFQLRTNLRYGTLILRHYIDIEKGDLYRALERYNSRGKAEYPALVVGAWTRHWDYEPSTTQQSFVVQIAAINDASRASDLKTRASQTGLSVYTDKVGHLTRVRVGPFETREKAVAAAVELAKLGISGQVVSVTSP